MILPDLFFFKCGNTAEVIRIDTNRSSDNDAIGGIDFRWNGTSAASIYGLASSDTGRGLAAGIGIVLLAIIIDIISLSWTKKQREALGL